MVQCVQGGPAVNTGGGASLDPFYFNSLETGGNGSDATCAMADDFHDGEWYHIDGDHSGSPAGTDTKGWVGNIFANPITPTNAVVAWPAGPGIGGSGYMATHGVMSGSDDEKNMASHDLKIQSVECRVRFLMNFSSGYLSGAEKVLVLNGFGGSGIQLGNWHLNLGAGSAQSSHNLDWQGAGGVGDSIFGIYTFTSGRLYQCEFRHKLSTTTSSADGIIQAWIDDAGTFASPSIPSSQTLVYSNTTVNYAKPVSTIGQVWFENFANPKSTGERRIGGVYVRCGVGVAQIGKYPR